MKTLRFLLHIFVKEKDHVNILRLRHDLLFEISSLVLENNCSAGRRDAKLLPGQVLFSYNLFKCVSVTDNQC